jgi:hypothetical protein
MGAVERPRPSKPVSPLTLCEGKNFWLAARYGLWRWQDRFATAIRSQHDSIDGLVCASSRPDSKSAAGTLCGNGAEFERHIRLSAPSVKFQSLTPK